MKKTTIVTFITALTLSINPVFAETLIQETSTSTSTVDAIIAEIEQAKRDSAPKQSKVIAQDLKTPTVTTPPVETKIVENKITPIETKTVTVDVKEENKPTVKIQAPTVETKVVARETAPIEHKTVELKK
ncbi:hypothetical protein N9X61_00080 [Sulfurimonas sp.]|nr:hypothetical protein [Sulfurimonas sp.]